MTRVGHAVALAMGSISLCPPALGLGLRAGSDTDGEGTECGTPGMTFPEFIQKFDRGYEAGSQDYAEREALFAARSTHVEEHNCQQKGPWKATVNHLADWTDVELQQLRGHVRNWGASGTAGFSTQLGSAGADITENGKKWPRIFHRKNENVLDKYPKSFSWANLTSIKEEKNQGQCGSCWAFASDCVLRAHAEIAGRDHKFSVSQVVSCSPNHKHCGGTGGCKGSTAELAFEYVMNAGLVSASEFPYPAGGGKEVCPTEMQTSESETITPFRLMEDGSEFHSWSSSDKRSKTGNNIGMTGWTKLPENKEDAVVRALVENGPVAIAVSAGFEWNFYWRGVMNHKACDKDHVVNHAVVLFGYGEDYSGGRYWFIKNSWGLHWGEKGNLKLERTKDEEKSCGWDRKPQLGSGCDGGPKEVWVCGTCGVLFDTVIPHFLPASGSAAGLAQHRGQHHWMR